MIRFLKLSVVSLILLIGCNNDKYIRTYKIYKKPPVKELNSSLLYKKFDWEKPESWIVSEGSSMRLASFKVPYSSGYGELSVSVLSGDGGGIQFNVNRWRGQLGLSDNQSLVEINSSSQKKTNDLCQYQIFKIINKSNSDMAFICAIMPLDNSTLFIKLKIPKIGINDIEKDFIDFCQSFKLSNK